MFCGKKPEADLRSITSATTGGDSLFWGGGGGWQSEHHLEPGLDVFNAVQRCAVGQSTARRVPTSQLEQKMLIYW